MTVQRTLSTTWPLDSRKLMPEQHQRAAWLAMADARDLLSDIARTMKLLSVSAFTGQEAALRACSALNMLLLEVEVEMGKQGVLEFAAPQRPTKVPSGGCASP